LTELLSQQILVGVICHMFERLGETDHCVHFADVNVHTHTHTHNKHEQFLQKIPLVMGIYSGN